MSGYRDRNRGRCRGTLTCSPATAAFPDKGCVEGVDRRRGEDCGATLAVQRAAVPLASAGSSENEPRITNAGDGGGFRGVTSISRSLTSQLNMKIANAIHMPSTTVQVPPMKESSRLRMPVALLVGGAGTGCHFKLNNR